MMRIRIIVTTQFEALHRWADCPFEDVSFLRYPHRHIFYVTMKFLVTHTDRDLEFIMVKHRLEQYVREHLEGRNLGVQSCEDLCVQLHSVFPDATYVSVFEDAENGVEVIVDEE